MKDCFPAFAGNVNLIPRLYMLTGLCETFTKKQYKNGNKVKNIFKLTALDATSRSYQLYINTLLKKHASHGICISRIMHIQLRKHCN